MPGIHLNHTEKSLVKQWDSAVYETALSGITISGKNGIRGLKDVDLQISYPVSVLCGKNGAGKTTLLSLAALAFHLKEGYHAKGANVVKNKNGDTYYTFQSFFFNGPKDASTKGVKIKWTFKKGTSREIVKTTNKWMHYDRRPSKAVCFLSTSRILSPMEQRGARTRFKKENQTMQAIPLRQEYIQYLDSILERNYEFAQELQSRDSNIRVCKNEVTYSSFNMGAGEDVIIELLSIIQELPDSSLLLIEEIEIGIHPSALRKLAAVLQEIALKKHMQIIITSHSRDFIDSLPRCARILVERNRGGCHITSGPSTSYAVSAMSNLKQVEMHVLCEDLMAKGIVEHALNKEQRKRVSISAIGSSSALAVAYRTLCLTSPDAKKLIIWDGDVSDKDVRTYIKGANDLNIDDVNYIFLHPSGTPEENLINSILNSSDAISYLASHFGTSDNELKDFLSNINAVSDGNHHNYLYKIAEFVDLSMDDVQSAVVSVANRVSAQNTCAIEQAVHAVLDGAKLTSHNRC